MAFDGRGPWRFRGGDACLLAHGQNRDFQEIHLLWFCIQLFDIAPLYCYVTRFLSFPDRTGRSEVNRALADLSLVTRNRNLEALSQTFFRQ
jgi:hypothetical protein